jgi:hypothetical protein
MRGRFREMMVTLELCRHPLSPHRARASSATGRHSGSLDPAWRSPDVGSTRARSAPRPTSTAFYGEKLPTLSEPALRSEYLTLEDPDPELAQRLEALHDLPADTLGYAYIEFYRRNKITVPGADVHTPAHYVSHDMNHVISGYEPTGRGEIALGAFTLAMNDEDANWIRFMSNRVIHEPDSCTEANSFRRPARSRDPERLNSWVRPSGAARNAETTSARSITWPWRTGRASAFATTLRFPR